ncbi:chemotaxis protein MotC [Pararhizobium gei]|uniref:chemotaxis protein MotC n=1 Tax=Pararhizobium gei TaxID=1395951 RepID=UPI0023DC5F0E|nr:chemotaxis protein MotC [Rhizobium gei]
MMMLIRNLLLGAAIFLTLPAMAVQASEPDVLPPYKMVRSLQYIQDTIILGDHSAAEMQSFLLGEIDKKLRSAERLVFDDPRNVDAAFIYAMSGGNPETLSYLADRDIEGNFDSRIVDALSHYLTGKGELMVESLQKVIPEYRTARIGPYLYLVLGNGMAQQNPKQSLKYYDSARLMSPGSNIEEAALRRSVALATRADMPDKGFAYSLSYARRFLTSPYASQFADVFVELAVANYSADTEGKVQEILSFMDGPRQREVYLRIARRAAIGGMQELASLAAKRAQSLSDGADTRENALANLYSGLVGVPSSDIIEAVNGIRSIPEADLSPRDRALRNAATAMAEAVLREPAADSLTQATPHKTDLQIEKSTGAEETGSGESPFAVSSPEPVQDLVQPAGDLQAASPQKNPPNPVLDAFLSTGRSKLGEIDALLGRE